MSNKMALDALTAALDAMEHMANTLNNMDAVDEDEDAQHDAAFEAVRAAIAALQAEPQGWMPISEFPKDETYRDGHNIYSKHALAWWPGAMEVTRVRWWQRDDTDASNFIADGGYAVFPTVFHALPTPPKD